MRLIEFLLSLEKILEQPPAVIAFIGKTYPYYFFDRLFFIIDEKKMWGYARAKHAFFTQHSMDVKNFSLRLLQGTLGFSYSYWLGDTTLLFSSKSHEQCLKFLATYTGPNKLLFFSDQPVSIINGFVVDIPVSLKKDEALYLLQWFAENDEKMASLLHPKKKAIIIKHLDNNYPLDVLCFLFEYVALTSLKQLDTFESYIYTLLDNSYSMQVLVDNFFNKNPERFFKEWSLVAEEYPPVFWLSFWSDLIWRAYSVIIYLENNKLIDAKKISYKLPYSFMDYGWKKYSKEYFGNLYKELYLIDFMNKKGAIFTGFDLLFFKHFI